jgi:hypothetical protein
VFAIQHLIKRLIFNLIFDFAIAAPFDSIQISLSLSLSLSTSWSRNWTSGGVSHSLQSQSTKRACHLTNFRTCSNRSLSLSFVLIAVQSLGQIQKLFLGGFGVYFARE